jgi:hypothetical protein
MATINQLTRLFKAVAAADLPGAQGVANEITQNEERRGHHVPAQQLRGDAARALNRFATTHGRI